MRVTPRFLAAVAIASCSNHRSPVRTQPDATPAVDALPGGAVAGTTTGATVNTFSKANLGRRCRGGR